MSSLGYNKPGFEAILHPTTLDIAWVAGIYEGEGSCDWKRGIVEIGQKDPWILYKLKDLFGGRVYKSKNTAPRTLKPGEIYRWAIYGARARGFGMIIYKFLSPRRKEQIKNLWNKLSWHKEKQNNAT